jgi:ribosome biogenesis protein YTM1
MSEVADPSTGKGQVQVYFVTSSADIELPEQKRQLLVPTSKSEKPNAMQ